MSKLSEKLKALTDATRSPEKDREKITQAITDITKLTDQNNHTEAVLYLAKWLGDIKRTKLLELVAKIHELERSIPKGIADYRGMLLDQLLLSVEQAYGKETRAAINGAF